MSRVLSATPSDPFDVLPIEMPHRSMELFHHCTFVPPCHASPPPARSEILSSYLYDGWDMGDEDRMAALRAPFQQLLRQHPLLTET